MRLAAQQKKLGLDSARSDQSSSKPNKHGCEIMDSSLTPRASFSCQLTDNRRPAHHVKDDIIDQTLEEHFEEAKKARKLQKMVAGTQKVLQPEEVHTTPKITSRGTDVYAAVQSFDCVLKGNFKRKENSMLG